MPKKLTPRSLESQQDKLIEQLDKKLNVADQRKLRDIINLEYQLTLIAEGHDIDTICI